jgi:nucleoside-diphosphate-sugar epimerase
MKTKVIITGATGMVGEGVLLHCLSNPDVEHVLIVNRRHADISHPKLKEIIHADFFNLAGLESQLSGYDACFFCLGVSSVGISQEEYKRMTQDLTLNFAELMVKLNPGMTFCYVTGAGTDSSEKGRMAWARVKGFTENTLIKMFRNAYMFRPGFMKAVQGQKHLKNIYKFLEWIYPIGKAIYPAGFCTLEEVGRAMVHAATRGYPKKVLEVKDIVELAKG